MLLLQCFQINFMQKIYSILCMVVVINCHAQTVVKDRIIYGTCTKDSLLQMPFSKWFNPNYTDYKPDQQTITALQKLVTKDISVKIFFGTWCGDSKREVSRFYKVLNSISFAENKVQLIGLGGSDSLYKQSPTKEEKGEGIFRVPVFIVYKNGKEINRINEFPANSLEKDLATILSSELYQPNYASFGIINKWLLNGSLADDNVNAVGLANQIKTQVQNENELNSLGYLMLQKNLYKEALKIFKINYNLYPQSTNVISSLGEAFLKNKDYEKAITFLEMALSQNKEPKDFKGILDLLYEAKGFTTAK
jgi:thiol-disulfide isomerase/thioredoxin